MSVPPVLATQTCIHCGALSQTKEGKCWLCYGSKSTPNPFEFKGNQVEVATPQSPMTTWDVVFSALLGICVLIS